MASQLAFLRSATGAQGTWIAGLGASSTTARLLDPFVQPVGFTSTGTLVGIDRPAVGSPTLVLVSLAGDEQIPIARGRHPGSLGTVVVAPSGRQLVYLNADAVRHRPGVHRERRRQRRPADHRLCAAHACRGLGRGELMRRLLFLIADTGGGHRAAATAVERQMTATWPGEFEITVLDPFTSAKPKVIGGTAGLYGPITRHARWLWGGLYYSTNTRPRWRCSNARCCDQ